MAGDFNIITQPVEMRNFFDTLLQISGFDLAYSGPLFTWSNHQPDGFLVRKLDRVLINDNWLSRFAQNMVVFLALEVSDHCLAFIHL